MRILVLNAGSSSLKASLVETDRREALGNASLTWGSDASRLADREESVRQLLDQLDGAGLRLDTIGAVGHRFVHGGPSFRQPVLVDDGELVQLERLVDLAPLHNGVAAGTIRAARGVLASVPHVCVFDTGFHETLPLEGFVYPLPWQWYEEWGIRRYGFHGLSVAWSVRRAAELLDRPPAELALVVAHLGSGCSVTAVDGGRSAATSMGLTPLEGLMMGTRAGSVDPGILLDVMRRGHVSLDGLAEALDHGSGLLGVSGLSGDVRELERTATEGNERASLALEIFVRRAAEGIAAAATALPRLDALVFSGGIGENAGKLRARIVDRLAAVGVASVEPVEQGTDRILSDAAAPVAVLRVEAREDLVIAEAVDALLDGGHAPAGSQRAVQPPHSSPSARQ